MLAQQAPGRCRVSLPLPVQASVQLLCAHVSDLVPPLLSVPILSPWLARNGPKEWCCCRRGPTCLGPLSLTGPMGMSGAGAQSQLLCGRGTLQWVEQKPRPRLTMVFLAEFSVLFSVLIMWTSCCCHPPGWAGGASRATLLLSLATALRLLLGILHSFLQRAGFLSLPLPVQAPWAHTEPESLPPPAYTQMGAHPTFLRAPRPLPLHPLLTRGTLGPSSLDAG